MSDRVTGAARPEANGTQGASTTMWSVSPAEQTAAVIPANMEFPPGDVRRYGADPTGARDSTLAFVEANSVASHGAGSIRIPAGRYKYIPQSRMDIKVSWFGDGPRETLLLCETSRFDGELFRIVGSTEMRDLLIMASGPKAGIGVRLAPLNSGEFTGHVRLTRLWVFGFDQNIRCDNNFEVTFDQVRSCLGNEGFYCAPDESRGNGYATTHLHLNCYYAQNGRNVFYLPSIRYAFRAITFLGGAIEGATGSACQASFTRCSPLKFIQLYLEGAAKIPALDFSDCDVSIDGAYLGGTGGIRVRGKSRIDLRQVRSMSASDLFLSEDGVRQIVMQDCRWPGSGNSMAAASVSLRNTSVNGVSYDDCAAEISSLGSIRLNRQSTLVNANEPQDVYRFADITGRPIGGSISGRFEIIARDKGDATNQSIYEFWMGSAAGGARHASLVSVQRMVRGTEVGAAVQPLQLADDGDRAGVKLQFAKNPSISQVVVEVVFQGLTNSY